MFLKRPVLRHILGQYAFLMIILVIFVLAEVLFWIRKDKGGFSVLSLVRSIAVGVVFFSSGVELKPREILTTAKQWQFLLLIQFLNFIMTPVLVRVGLFFIPFIIDIDKWIITGFFAVSCLPPSISSAVLLTKSSRGNETVAVLSSILGAFLGIFLTPLLLLFHVGISCTLPALETLTGLAITEIGPFFAGLVAQNCFCLIRNSFCKNFLPNLALIFVIFSSFYEMLGKIDLVVSAQEVLFTLILVILVQTAMNYLYLRVALELDSVKALSAADLVSLIFCSSHKSLTLGLPLLKTLYGGYSHLSQISLPLLIYHSVQLLIGALISPFVLKWTSLYVE